MNAHRLCTVLAVFSALACTGARAQQPSVIDSRTRENCDTTSAATAKAYALSQKFVTPRLFAPGSAVFPALDENGVSVQSQSQCEFLVRGFVDSTNSIGRQTRIVYRITLIYSPASDDWSARDVQVLEPR